MYKKGGQGGAGGGGEKEEERQRMAKQTKYTYAKCIVLVRHLEVSWCFCVSVTDRA